MFRLKLLGESGSGGGSNLILHTSYRTNTNPTLREAQIEPSTSFYLLLM
jgi:hypothetical protein